MKNRKLIVLLASLFVMVFAFAACSDDNDTTPADGERRVLRVGMEAAYPPFNWSQPSSTLPDGTPAVPIVGSPLYAGGYDVAVAQMIADYLGWDLEIHQVEWVSIIPSLDAGDYDVILAGMGWSEARSTILEFTRPYFYRELAVTVLADGPFSHITGLSEFYGTGARVITQLGALWAPYIELQFPAGIDRGIDADSVAGAFAALVGGSVDAIVFDYPTSRSATMTDARLMVLELDPDDDVDGSVQNRVSIATRLGETELRDDIQRALDANDWTVERMNELMAWAMTQQPGAQ